ncbi:DUF1937 family protein [Tranquillimonas rosea]|uniref:DUF1937 family protein n=1 Tax=Tranquillimonas rosea TaxID=641238 RepID=UPI003BA9FE78
MKDSVARFDPLFGLSEDSDIHWPALRRAAPQHVFSNMPLDHSVAAARGKLVYLATPFRRQVVDSKGRFSRRRAIQAAARAQRWVGALAVERVTAISPVALSVNLSAGPAAKIDPMDDDFWSRWFTPLLTRADLVMVPPLEGWAESEGVWREALVAVARGIPVHCIGEDLP